VARAQREEIARSRRGILVVDKPFVAQQTFTRAARVQEAIEEPLIGLHGFVERTDL
jgi:hypothetical protein